MGETLTEGQFDFLVGEVERTYAADSPLDDNLVRSVCREARRLRAESARLRAALTDARESIQGWGSQASEYLRDKYDLAGDLAAIEAALNGEPRDPAG